MERFAAWHPSCSRIALLAKMHRLATF